jgi:1-acyl-sn-glycerol-3-phosphate acyltransferase
VLAIASGAPIVPVLLHGTHDVFPKNGWLVRPGQFDIHLLEPVPTAGLDYPDREELAEKVRNQIVDALASIYGIESEPTRSSR